MSTKLLFNQIQQPTTSTNQELKSSKPTISRYPVTDLDKSDEDAIKPDKPKKPHRHRDRKQTETKKYSGNFAEGRSRSAEYKIAAQRDVNDIEQLKIMVQTKDDQIEKLVKKITEVYGHNEEFSKENQKLTTEIQQLNKKIENLSISLQRTENKICENCSVWQNEKENLTECNKSLKNDVEMMKTLVYRLNVQIERYQDKERKFSTELPNDEPDNNCHLYHPTYRSKNSLHWGSVNTHTLAPLLNSYEEMIREKEDLIQNYESEMNRFTGQLKEILDENERLHKEIDESRKGKDGWREERTRMQAQLDVCRSKAELQTRRGDIAKEKLVEVLRCYEQKVQSQSLDLERLQEAYGRAKGELVSYKNLNQQPEVIIESLKECQKLFEDLKSEHQNDKSKLLQELQEIKKTNLELQTKNHSSKEEVLNLKVEIKKLSCNIEELNDKNCYLKKSAQKLKESRDRLKARLRIALQWAHKLDESQQKMKNTWDELKQLEAIVRHKESQIRGLHARHIEEVGKLEKKLIQRDETIKNILKERTKTNN
ncbi:protein Cep89 homolog [Condylostylus longicornis]|uniref:protein Cep89 homolog n=1 Tax=Condylostylus longicornis TaxID=2530218 RepID=UPI00244D998E|nr:protein Cep89 homolog [Condylostylus longicornis]